MSALITSAMDGEPNIKVKVKNLADEQDRENPQI